MTVRLSIDEQAWRDHVADTVSATPHIVPVVKGNGYGFGREVLTRASLGFADQIAVGTVHELHDVCRTAGSHTAVRVISLTPALHLPDELPPAAVPTVGSPAHVDALRRHGWRGAVAVKLESSMHRHGTSPEALSDVLAAIRTAGCHEQHFLLHLPLASPTFTADDAVAQIAAWLPHLDSTVPISVSHLPPTSFDRLCGQHPTRRFRLRSGTALWHGDKSFLTLAADVLAARPIRAGSVAGYRQRPVEHDGHLVTVGAGSAHGVTPLDGGLSPFHHRRHRLTLVEAPHMHTSMVLIPTGSSVPAVGEWVDVQRPLITVFPDVLDWR